MTVELASIFVQKVRHSVCHYAGRHCPKPCRYLAGYGTSVFTSPAHVGVILVMFGG